MEKNRFPTDREEIEKICEKYRITNYTLNSDGSIDVDGNVDLSISNLDKLPLKFNKVGGYFSCSDNQLKTLEGAPKEVGGSFMCNSNLLTSLKGSPKKLEADFYCHNNILTTLEGAPREVGGFFYCRDNKLKRLEGAPKEVGGVFYCERNPLESIEGISIAKRYNIDETPFAWALHELQHLLSWGLDFGLTADECLCLSDTNPNRENMMKKMDLERRKRIEVLSKIYQIKDFI